MLKSWLRRWSWERCWSGCHWVGSGIISQIKNTWCNELNEFRPHIVAACGAERTAQQWNIAEDWNLAALGLLLAQAQAADSNRFAIFHAHCGVGAARREHRQTGLQ